MDYRHPLLCRAETRRLLWLLGITFSAVMAFQYFELPYGSLLSSLLSTAKVSFQGKGSFPSGDESSKSELFGSTSVLNGLNSTMSYAVHETANATVIFNSEKETDGGNNSKNKTMRSNVVPESSEMRGSSNGAFGYVNKENSLENVEEQTKNTSLVKFENSEHGAALEKTEEPRQSVPSKNATTSDSGTSVSSFDSNTSSSHKDSVQSNLTLSNYSSSPPEMNKRFGLLTSEAVSISKMNALLLLSRASPNSMAPRWFSPVDQELLYAKSQIENAPNLKNDMELYASLYRNVSMFKRSYELMENMLKVFIYKEGEKPIFHDSILEGIYSSEGWFIKLMEASKHFATDDPRRAHLFYLPFSSRLLELTLYVPNSHNRNNLIEYMKNYVERLATTYPYWNRTGGADHFLGACHDWAPAETRGRLANCLRALCNADLKTGFDIGKDTSLPTTYVRSAANPLKGIGGEPPSNRTNLAFFAGHMHGRVRPVLLKYWGNKDPDMKIFARLPPVRGNKNYIQLMKTSRYCICARGYAVNSPRVVESIYYECVPVIISDNYVPPFFEILNWESFAVFVLEKDIPDLKNILLSIPDEKYLEMQKRVKMVQQHFIWHAEPVKYDSFHMILHSIWYNRVFQMRNT